MATKSLPVPPSPQTLQMLSRARALLAHADKHLNSGADIDLMIAVHNLDNALEYLARVTLIHLGYEEWDDGKPIETLQDVKALWAEVRKYLKSEYGFELRKTHHIGILRTLRNAIQHGLVSPTNDVDRLRGLTHELFDLVVSECFGANTGEYTYSSIVAQPNLQQELAKAEKLFLSGDFRGCVEKCGDVFDFSLILLHSLLDDVDDIVPVKIELRNHFEWLPEYLEAVSRRVALTRLDVNWYHYHRFKELKDRVDLGWTKLINRATGAWRDWDRTDAAFSYSFVCDFVFRNSAHFDTSILTIHNADVRTEYLGGVCLDGIASSYAWSGFAPYDDIDAGYTDEVTCESLRRLGGTVEKVYGFSDDGQKDVVGGNKVEIGYIGFTRACKSPELWRVIVATQTVPYSSWRYERIGNKVVDQTLSLSSATSEQLYEKLSSHGLTRADCRRIVATRKKLGGFSRREDVEGIQGLHGSKHYGLIHFTSLGPPPKQTGLIRKLLWRHKRVAGGK